MQKANLGLTQEIGWLYVVAVHYTHAPNDIPFFDGLSATQQLMQIFYSSADLSAKLKSSYQCELKVPWQQY